ncbi:MAG: ABC transporter ATP-binding protein [Gemmatimonadota bacterium]
MNPSILELRSLTRRFGDFTALDGISLAIAPGEFLTLLGASGSGKTTTLRLLAGFDQPDSGSILMDGVDIAGLPSFKRSINTVFQQYALFPHMSVRENVGYGLRMRKVNKAEIRSRVDEALEMVQLGQLEARAPRQLSGGQQQRVALARALVNRPRVLLLDEPLGALDLKLRKEMQLELKHLQTLVGITFIYVTHDQEEALTMSDRVVVMRQGKIEQIGTPKEIYAQPTSRYVADFIGETNLLTGEVTSLDGRQVTVRCDGSSIVIPVGAMPVVIGDRVWFSVRPESMAMGTGPAAGEFNHLEGTLTDTVYAGAITRLHLALTGGKRLVVHQAAGGPLPEPGARVAVQWRPSDGVLLPDRVTADAGLSRR